MSLILNKTAALGKTFIAGNLNVFTRCLSNVKVNFTLYLLHKSHMDTLFRTN